MGREHDTDVKLSRSAEGAVDASGVNADHVSIGKLEPVCLLKRLQAVSTGYELDHGS